jgi:hypothetical protein
MHGAMIDKQSRAVGASAPQVAAVGSSPTDDDAIPDLELDDPTIDEAELPRLDTDDAEAIGQEPGYDDLLDRRWLERAADDGVDEEDDGLDGFGLTIDLDGPDADEDGAQVLDLDVGSLLTALPSDGTELDLEPFGHERSDVAMGVGVLRDMLLPDSDDEGRDDSEVGDDDRFPAFDDGSGMVPRPILDDDEPSRDDELS